MIRTVSSFRVAALFAALALVCLWTGAARCADQEQPATAAPKDDAPAAPAAEAADKPADTPKQSPQTKRPGKSKPADAAPIYVGAYSVDHEFQFVTDECMEILRTKRILFGSRSWGINLGKIMSSKDPKYALTWEPYNTPQISDQNRVLKPDVFDQPKIVHYIFQMDPRRWAYLDDFLRKDPWKFGSKIDAAFQSLYCGPKKEAEQMAAEYFPMLDKLVKDFPNVKFAIWTHPVSGDGLDHKGQEKPPESDWNIGGGDYSDAVVRRYYGKLPILDIRDIVSTLPDGKPCTFQYNGKTYRKMCPEYHIERGKADLIHANSPEGRERLAKGFILLLAKMFCADKMPPMETPKPEILQSRK
jgi:hypothetical protein